MPYQLAELNIARFKEPIDSPVNKEFVDNLDRVNALAEGSPGFIWRLTGEGNDAMDVDAYDDPNIAVNLSVWKDKASLFDFVYKNPEHKNIMMRRKEWFERMQFYVVLWWVEEGHQPTIEEAKSKLAHLEANGPSETAFTFSKSFPPKV